MPRPKGKRTFLKIKEKLVFLPPKKFWGRRFVGIILLVCGSLILAFSVIYFYIIPNFFPPKTKIIKVTKEAPPFSAKRILIPSLNLSYLVSGGIEGEVPSSLAKIKKGEEVFLLGQENYRVYRITKVESKPESLPSGLSLADRTMELILLSKAKPSRNIIIEAELEEANF